MALDCLDTLVGITPRDCNCLSGEGYFTDPEPLLQNSVRESFLNQDSNVLTYNAGTLPDSGTETKVFVYQQGQKLIEGSSYTISGNDIIIDSSAHYSGANYEVFANIGTGEQVATSGLNTSESGYYIDDYEYGFPFTEAVLASQDCGDTGFWGTMLQARNEAIRDVKMDLQQALGEVRESKQMNWRGLVGKKSNTSFANSTSDRVGIQILPRNLVKDANFIVKAVHLKTNQTQSITINVTSNDSTFTSASVEVSGVANVWTRAAFDSEIELPLYSLTQEDLRYNVWYERTGKPAANKVFCCRRPEWATHLAVRGFEISESDFTEEVEARSSLAYGISLEGYFKCNKLDWICNLEELNGVDFRDLVARVIQMRSGIKIYSKVLQHTEPTKFSMIPPDGMIEKRDQLGERYNETIRWIAHHLPPNVSGCWGCRRGEPTIISLA